MPAHNAPFTTMLSFLPMFTLWVMKTDPSKIETIRKESENQMPSLYVPRGRFGRPGNAIDPDRCRAQTYEQVSRNFNQCARKKVVEVDGIGYCKQHSPEAEAARNAAARARDEAGQRRRDRQWKRPNDYMTALREIASGHNDPRAVAIEVLEKWNDLPNPTLHP